MARLYGKGTVTEIVKGKKYRIALSAGKDPVSGRYLRVQETFLGTKRQAQLRIEEIRRELESGKAPNADKVTFAEWCEKYLTMRESTGKYRPATLKLDRSRSKHLIAGLGDVRIADITPAVVDSLYASMRKNGTGDTTMQQVHKLLKRIMRYAVDNDLIIRNPVDRVETPKKPKPHREALSNDEARRLGELVTAGTPTANKVCVYLGLSLGARLGEVLGLTWGHVVLDGNRPFAHIIQQHTQDNRRTALKTDKDENPVGRVVPLDSSTVAVLKAWKSEQVKQLNVLGVEQGTATPIITSAHGQWLDHSKFSKWWRCFCVDNGFGRWLADDGRAVIDLRIGDNTELYPADSYLIEWRDSDGWPCDEKGKRYSRSYKRPKIKRHYDGLNYHELRHTHFTMRLAAGMDIPTAQALGGWSTPTVLLNTYAHPTPENVWAAAGFMDELTAKQFA